MKYFGDLYYKKDIYKIKERKEYVEQEDGSNNGA